MKDKVYEAKTTSGHTVRIVAPNLIEARRLAEKRWATNIITIKQARGWREV